MYRIKPIPVLCFILFLFLCIFQCLAVVATIMVQGVNAMTVLVILVVGLFISFMLVLSGSLRFVTVVKLHRIVPKLEATAVAMQTDRSKISDYKRLKNKFDKLREWL